MEKRLPRYDLTIVSGGQTGVDRAALDFAIARGYPHGGWCPRGRRAEDGVLHDRYQLVETESRNYRQRTRRNVTDSDATLILSIGEPEGGTLTTLRYAQQYSKPMQVVSLDRTEDDSVAIMANRRKGTSFGAAMGRFRR